MVAASLGGKENDDQIKETRKAPVRLLEKDDRFVIPGVSQSVLADVRVP
jgi:hypothetical protein